MSDAGAARAGGAVTALPIPPPAARPDAPVERTEPAILAPRTADALLLGMADVILAAGPDDRITDTRTRTDLLGDLALPALGGQRLLDQVYAASRANVEQACARARHAPGLVVAVPGVRLLTHRDGTDFPTPRLDVWLLADRAGGLLLCGLRAASDRPHQDSRWRGADRFHRIYDASPDAILVLRQTDQRLLDCNEGFTRLLGYSRADAIGRPLAALRLWPSATEHSRLFAALLADGEINDVETSLRGQDGAERSVAISLRYLEFADEPCILAVARNISRRLQAESAARRSEAKFTQVFRESPDGIIILRQSDLTIRDVNPAFLLGAGLALDRLVGQKIDQFYGVLDVAALRLALDKLERQGWFRNIEMTFRQASGREIPTLVSGALIDLDGEPGVLCVSKNVSELREAQEQLRQSEERFRGAFESAPIGILLLDLRGQIFQANRFAADLLDYTPARLDGACVTDLVPAADRDSLLNELAQLIEGRELISRSERRMRRANGVEIWATLHIVLQRSASGDPLYCILQIADITDMKNSQQAMERLAFYDTLTELANRRLFNERLTQAVNICNREQHQAALLYLDLDQFKRVNDTLGHDSGDQLLREVASRLLKCVRVVDTVARTGGDEFSILLGNVDSPVAAADVARRILRALRAPVQLAGHELVVTTSIGITLIPDDGSDPNRLLKNADLAMYRAKASGRNNFQYYSEALNVDAARRLRTESELRQALERREFILHYQPKVRVQDRSVVGFECLLRWQHPKHGLLGPDQFITVAEESGVVVDIGHWIIAEACRAGQELTRIAGRPLTIGVNVSPRQFRDTRLVQTVEDSLRRARLNPDRLEIEITETMLMEDIETTSAMVRRLAELGVRVAIDDFGTGYSSLNHLRKFPISTIKVDRSFIGDIPTSGDDMAITAAVIAMAHKLHVQVVAEGVETADQHTFLIDHGCDFAQGYLFGKAASFEATRALLAPHPDRPGTMPMGYRVSHSALDFDAGGAPGSARSEPDDCVR